MSKHVTGVDHVVILVRDLDQSERRLSALGFSVTPRGYHSEKMGTANNTVMFRDPNYFETLAVLKETPNSAGFARFLAEREGICAVAFQSDDARAAAADFEAGGFGSGEAVDFSRPVELAEGTREAAFTVARMSGNPVPGLETFVCQHHTPDVTWRPDYLDHDNTALGLVEIVGVADDFAPLTAGYERIFGAGVARSANGILTIATGNVPIRYIPPEGLAARFAGIGRLEGARTPYLLALSFRVGDLAATAGCLTRHAIDHLRSNTGSLLVPPADACGTLMEFIATA